MNGGGGGMIRIPQKIGEVRKVGEAWKRREDLLELYMSADDPALIEVLTKKIRDLQVYIDNVREH